MERTKVVDDFVRWFRLERASMRIILVAVLATMMCAPAGFAQNAKQKSPEASASSQRQLSPAERVRCKQAPQALSAANRRACRSIGNGKKPPGA